ncbi:hypothetical protein K438DRAFT_409085 [Mycena galopus ATCC 62051]|nr:hypothetical protein K438DRAFT_409085 [Mycena galopus ATCC 62051]
MKTLAENDAMKYTIIVIFLKAELFLCGVRPAIIDQPQSVGLPRRVCGAEGRVVSSPAGLSTLVLTVLRVAPSLPLHTYP